MKRNINCFMIFIYIFLFGIPNCNSSQIAKYKLILKNSDNEIILTSLFSCQDENNDGIIEISELKEFKETGKHVFSEFIGVQTGGWRSDIDVKNLPIITHTVEDIKVSRFNEKEFKKGSTIIEYETETKNDFKFKSYYFMRIVEIKENGKKIDVVSWVGDGTQGLELAMQGTEAYTLKIEKR